MKLTEFDCEKLQKAVNFQDLTRELNIITIFVIILIGLVGNILGIVVFVQKRFRMKASGVFLLVLVTSDGLFLLTHFFEDTLRTYIDYYIRKNRGVIPFKECTINAFNTTNSSSENSIFLMINITDKYDLTCRVVNYLRYFLRFISAYIITIFTIQRAIAIYFPFYQKKIASPTSAWKIVIGLITIGIILCSFVPLLFKLNEDTSNGMSVIYCDTDKSHGQLYFITTIIYIVLIMFIPITTIFICNTLIIIQVCRATKNRELMISGKFAKTNSHSINEENNEFLESNNKRKASQMNKSRKINNESNKVTKMLIIMSLSYAILNLPYFITWCMFYYSKAIKKEKEEKFIYYSYLFGFINLAEIFYVLNYGIHFFLYCASGRQFREQLKVSLLKKKRTNASKL